MLSFPRWKVWGISLLCALGVLMAVPSLLPANAFAALPIQSFAERDGSFVNGERRAQRFYTAQGPLGKAIPAWEVSSQLSERLGHGRAKYTAAAVMHEISQNVNAFAGARFPELAKVERQFPDVGGENLYYGGTAYQNRGGLGIQIPTAADKGEPVNIGDSANSAAAKTPKGKLLVVPTTRLYNRERAFTPSELMHARIPDPFVEMNSADAKKLGIGNGDMVQVTIDNGPTVRLLAHVNGGAPVGSVVLPRHLTDEVVPLSISTGSVAKV